MGAFAVYLSNTAQETTEVVRAMSAVVPHRGNRIATLMQGRCAIATVTHDDVPDAYVGRHNGMVVAFVGTLDNAEALARDLKNHGTAASDATPPALLAAGFLAYGETLPARLRGVFAGVVTDGERVYCFRDHVGYRAVFYRADARGFYAASEAKQVVAGAGIPREPDLDVVEGIFFRDLDDDTPSALRGIRRLPKSTSITVDRDGVRLGRYWRPESLLESAKLSTVEVQERFDELMDQAVTRSMATPAVVSLSGGIDSPAIAAFAAPRHLQLFGKPLQAVSVVYPRFPSVDERKYVELLADHFRIPLHLFEQNSNALAGLARWVELADTPFPAASLAHYEEDYLRVRKLGFRTILSGEHAEFVFAMQWYLLDHYLTHGRFRAIRRDLSARRAKGRSWVSIARLVARSLAPGAVLDIRDRRRRHSSIPLWVDKHKALSAAQTPVKDRWRTAQLSGFHGPGLSLEAEEICQAVCGVRARRPWTDVDLWEFFLSLPAEQKFPESLGKSLVRKLLRGRVPDEILQRRDKTVFDEAMLAEIDYPALRRFLVSPAHRIDGVDYGLLRQRLEAEDLGIVDYLWTRNLASAHAFLAQW